MLQISDYVSIVTALGVIGTIILGFLNLKASKSREIKSQSFQIKEKQKDAFITLCSNYISMLRIESVMVRADNFDDYGISNEKTQNILFEAESTYNQILLHINSENPVSQELEFYLERSISIMSEVQRDWSTSTFAFVSIEEGQDFKGRTFNYCGHIYDGKELEEIRQNMLSEGVQKNIESKKDMNQIKKNLIRLMKNYLSYENKDIINVTKKTQVIICNKKAPPPSRYK